MGVSMMDTPFHMLDGCPLLGRPPSKQKKRRPITKLQPEVKYLWAAFDVCSWIDPHLHKDFSNYKEAFDKGACLVGVQPHV